MSGPGCDVTEEFMVAMVARRCGLGSQEVREGLKELVDKGWLTPDPSPIGLARYVLTIPKGAKRGR